jgi:two-component system copper resistance phosphate regulon response regulator CusR
VKILVIEDEPAAAGFLMQGLREEGFAVDHAANSADAAIAIDVHEYDLILLDVMIPGKDGFELCSEWRKAGLKTPILFLTARSEVRDRVAGLDLGGDDYLVKPYSFEELLARVRMLIRRGASSSATSVLTFGDLAIDTRTRTARRGGVDLDLTAKEYQLLEFFAHRVGSLVTRTDLWEHVWESYNEPDSNVVDVYVGYLRNKLGRNPDLIKTRRGAGYVFEPEPKA